MPKTQRREGGRSALVLAAVRSAVEELITELGAENVTIGLIADRSGVNKTSIYRRWGDFPTLLNEIATYRLDPHRPLPNTGDFWTNLQEWSGEVARHFSTPTNAALLRAGAALAQTASRDCTASRRLEAQMLVDQSTFTAPHQRLPTAEQIADHILSPIIMRVIFATGSPTDATIQRLVNELRTVLNSNVGGQCHV